MTQFDRELKTSLFLLRVSVFLVMIMWTIDKFVNPDHAARVFEHFYFMGGLKESVFTIIGLVQLIGVLAFLFGIAKKWSYGFVLVIHAISTLSSYEKYFAPWEKVNLLFFAAWPMLASIAALYILRDRDTLFTWKPTPKSQES